MARTRPSTRTGCSRSAITGRAGGGTCCRASASSTGSASSGRPAPPAAATSSPSSMKTPRLAGPARISRPGGRGSAAASRSSAASSRNRKARPRAECIGTRTSRRAARKPASWYIVLEARPFSGCRAQHSGLGQTSELVPLFLEGGIATAEIGLGRLLYFLLDRLHAAALGHRRGPSHSARPVPVLVYGKHVDDAVEIGRLAFRL